MADFEANNKGKWKNDKADVDEWVRDVCASLSTWRLQPGRTPALHDIRFTC